MPNAQQNQSAKTTGRRRQPKTNTQNNAVVVRQAPAARGAIAKRSPPSVVFNLNGDCVITHSEYVSDVSASATFVAVSYDIDPQEASTFTWLSAIASRFEKSSFTKLMFEYKPSCSTATTGWIILGYDPDYYDSAPTKSSALAWRDVSKTVPWAATSLNATKTVSELGRRFHGPTLRGDQRMTNFGKLWVLSDQAAGTANVGEIYVTYTVKFHIPAIKLPAALYGTMSRDGSSGFVQTSGNIKTTFVNAGDFVLNSVGSYLVESYNDWVTSISTNDLTFTTPSNSLLSEYAFSELERTVDSTDASGMVTYLLTLAAGTVLITSVTTGTGGFVRGLVRLATMKFE